MKLPCRTFREFLELKQLLNGSDDAIEQARGEWKRLYAKAYWASYRKVQFSLVLMASHMEYVNAQATRYSLKATDYVIHLIEQDRNGEALAPDLLIDIEVGLLSVLDYIEKKVMSHSALREHFVEISKQIENVLTSLEK